MDKGVGRRPERRRPGHASIVAIPNKNSTAKPVNGPTDIIADLGRLFQTNEETSQSMSSGRDAFPAGGAVPSSSAPWVVDGG
jgi:hypothetical protein